MPYLILESFYYTDDKAEQEKLLQSSYSALNNSNNGTPVTTKSGNNGNANSGVLHYRLVRRYSAYYEITIHKSPENPNVSV